MQKSDEEAFYQALSRQIGEQASTLAMIIQMLVRMGVDVKDEEAPYAKEVLHLIEEDGEYHYFYRALMLAYSNTFEIKDRTEFYKKFSRFTPAISFDGKHIHINRDKVHAFVKAIYPEYGDDLANFNLQWKDKIHIEYKGKGMVVPLWWFAAP